MKCVSECPHSDRETELCVSDLITCTATGVWSREGAEPGHLRLILSSRRLQIPVYQLETPEPSVGVQPRSLTRSIILVLLSLQARLFWTWTWTWSVASNPSSLGKHSQTNDRTWLNLTLTINYCCHNPHTPCLSLCSLLA